MTEQPESRIDRVLENQISRRERSRRGGLLRSEAGDLEWLASESSLPTNLVEVAHQARINAVQADPSLSTITETEAIIQAVLDEQERTKPVLDIAQEAVTIRRRILKRLVAELEFPTPKNAAAAEYQSRILMRVKKFTEAEIE